MPGFGVCCFFTEPFPERSFKRDDIAVPRFRGLRKRLLGTERHKTMYSMKKTRFWFLLGLVTAIAFCFSACSDDDDDNKGGNSSELVGTWESVSFYNKATLYDKKTNKGTVIEEGTEKDNTSRVILNGDGTCKSLEYEDGKWYDEDEGTWTYKDGCLYITTEDGTEKFTVKEATGSKLVLENVEIVDYTNEYTEYYELSEYRKVSN